MSEETTALEHEVDTAIAAAYGELDRMNHEQLCNCYQGVGSCVTYGSLIPWSYDEEAFAREAIAHLLKARGEQ